MQSIASISIRIAASVFALGISIVCWWHSAHADDEKTLTVVAFGDSTTAKRDDLQIYADLLQKELPEQGVAVKIINQGVGNNTTEDGRNRFEKDVLKQHPNVVVIQFGINDSSVEVWRKPPASEPRVLQPRYEENLRYFAQTLKKQGVRVILMTPNPTRWTPVLKRYYGKAPYDPDDVEGLDVLLKKYADTVRKVADEERVTLIDVYKEYVAQAKQKKITVDDLLLDGMHPNNAGQRLVADLLIEKIKQY